MSDKQKPQGGPGGKMKPMKPKNAGKTIKRLLSYVAKSKGLLLLVFLMVIISSVANIAGTYILSPIVDELGNLLNTGSNDLSNVIKYLFILGCVYLCGAGAQYGQSRIMLNVAQGTLNI